LKDTLNQPAGWLEAGDTVRFRQRHGAEMKTVFLAVLRLCQQALLVWLGLVALDGTKVQGNASLEANRTAAGIGAEIEKMLAEAETTDAREDRQPAAQQGAALPQTLAGRAERLARLRKCKEKLERQAAAAAGPQAEEHDGTRTDGPKAAHQAWARPLSPPRRLRRAGDRPDDGGDYGEHGRGMCRAL